MPPRSRSRGMRPDMQRFVPDLNSDSLFVEYMLHEGSQRHMKDKCSIESYHVFWCFGAYFEILIRKAYSKIERT